MLLKQNILNKLSILGHSTLFRPPATLFCHQKYSLINKCVLIHIIQVLVNALFILLLVAFAKNYNDLLFREMKVPEGINNTLLVLFLSLYFFNNNNCID